MDFRLTDEQVAVRETFHAFAEREVRPLAAALDQEPRFPTELFRKAGELGLFGMRYEEPLGSGADVVSYCLAMEELSWGSLSLAAACAMQSLMGTYFIHRFASEEIRERLLLPALRGETVGAICMTEPDAGSDLFGMQTKAREEDGTYLVTGRKTWVTSAREAAMFTVFAKTGDRKLSVFLVERGTSGVTISRDIEKMGVRSSLTSEVSFDEASATCLLGEWDQGQSYLRDILAQIRVMTGALALGVARAALEEALRYARERSQFGRPIIKFQAIQAHLAEMATKLEAARQLVYLAAWREDQGMENALHASMAKLFASEAALEICERAARILASYGYATEYPVERYLRDVRFTLIGGGTSEILRVNIAKGLK